MSTRRAILVDIHEKGLDPKKPHKTLSSSGHFRPAPEQHVVVDEVVVNQIVHEKPSVSEQLEVDETQEQLVEVEQVPEETKVTVADEPSVSEHAASPSGDPDPQEDVVAQEQDKDSKSVKKVTRKNKVDKKS